MDYKTYPEGLHDAVVIQAQRPANVSNAEVNRELFPFESKWFRSSVGPVHFIDEGQGRPILFLHGNPDWSFLYRKIITQLRPEFRCIALDYPGFGLSVHPDGYGYTAAEHSSVVRELVAALDLEDAIIMGQDWGGPIGLDVASRMPGRFSGVVMANTFYELNAPGRVFARVMRSGLMQHLIVRRNFFVKRLMKTAIKARISPEEFRHYLDVAPTPESRVGFAVFPRQLNDARGFLNQVKVRSLEHLSDKPMLLFFGRKDPMMGSRSAQARWQADFPAAKVVVVKGAGHYIQEDAANRIAAGISDTFAG